MDWKLFLFLYGQVVVPIIIMSTPSVVVMNSFNKTNAASALCSTKLKLKCVCSDHVVVPMIIYQPTVWACVCRRTWQVTGVTAARTTRSSSPPATSSAVSAASVWASPTTVRARPGTEHR